jgi:hypothetical protein
MEANVLTIERAFQLAATGRYVTVSELKLRLNREGYDHLQVEGALLHQQLKDAMAQARAARSAIRC